MQYPAPLLTTESQLMQHVKATHKLARIISCLYRWPSDKLKQRLHSDQTYQYPNFSIALPTDHLLPAYQKAHKNYDQFLPHLVKYLTPGTIAIDIGANCGDSFAAMVSQNSQLQYLCIEPDDTFFAYLEKNISNIKSKVNCSVTTAKSLVGDTVSNVMLTGSGGTKTATLHTSNCSQPHQSKTLDAIVHDIFGSEVKKIDFIKSDVDGYDYDVINSAKYIIDKHKPILFFEADYTNSNQKSGYVETISWLFANGYNDYWIFDNFGELLLHTSSPLQISNLIEYIWRQKNSGSSRTIFYFDILSCSQQDTTLLSKIISEYISKLSNNTGH